MHAAISKMFFRIMIVYVMHVIDARHSACIYYYRALKECSSFYAHKDLYRYNNIRETTNNLER